MSMYRPAQRENTGTSRVLCPWLFSKLHMNPANSTRMLTAGKEKTVPGNRFNSGFACVSWVRVCERMSFCCMPWSGPVEDVLAGPVGAVVALDWPAHCHFPLRSFSLRCCDSPRHGGFRFYDLSLSSSPSPLLPHPLPLFFVIVFGSTTKTAPVSALHRRHGDFRCHYLFLSSSPSPLLPPPLPLFFFIVFGNTTTQKAFGPSWHGGGRWRRARVDSWWGWWCGRRRPSYMCATGWVWQTHPWLVRAQTSGGCRCGAKICGALGFHW